MIYECDLIVIGSGIAGLTFALKVADQLPQARISVLTKQEAFDTATSKAQGGIAVVMDAVTDSKSKHINDTLVAGDGRCDEDTVRFVIENSQRLLTELVNWGASFDKNHAGDFHLGKEGGHSANRIVHHKDTTGHEVQTALLAALQFRDNVTLFPHHFVLDLAVQELEGHKRIRGAFAIDRTQKRMMTFSAQAVFIATGGIGQVYASTTNPLAATGDGIAMAKRAGATIKDMQFVQFHPTSFYDPSNEQVFLISEAVRGAGARLRNENGELFMSRYDAREDLAPRDIVARAMFTEMHNSRGTHVYLDCRDINKRSFKAHFPTILQHLNNQEIDPFTSMIPVVPAAHYNCGGIKIDLDGRTAIEGLFAGGECVCSGLHGANRLASNSLLEGLVLSDTASVAVSEFLKQRLSQEKEEFWSPVLRLDTIERGTSFVKEVRSSIGEIMSEHVGIQRTNEGLHRALNQLKVQRIQVQNLISDAGWTVDRAEVLNLVTVGLLVVEQSLEQAQNCGVFFNLDLCESERTVTSIQAS